jgi:hypothetical protein
MIKVARGGGGGGGELQVPVPVLGQLPNLFCRLFEGLNGDVKVEFNKWRAHSRQSADKTVAAALRPKAEYRLEKEQSKD